MLSSVIAGRSRAWVLFLDSWATVGGLQIPGRLHARENNGKTENEGEWTSTPVGPNFGKGGALVQFSSPLT